MAIPGLRFLAFAMRWFDAATVSRVFEPLIADWQREWSNASPSRRARIRARGTLAFVIAAAALAPRALLMTPAPPSITRRVISRIIIFTGIVSSLLTMPFLLDAGELTFSQLMIGTLFLLPAGIALGFPFSTVWATDGIRRHALPTPAERVAAVRLGVVAVLFNLTFVGWVVPESNQQWRQMAAPEWARPPQRGARELTTPQLFTAPWLARAEGRQRSVAVQRELHQRASFALLPAVLIWLRWRALGHPSPQWLLPSWLSATVMIGAYFFLRENDLAIESTLGLTPGAAAWLPLAVFLAIGWFHGRTNGRAVTSTRRL
jgi:hypothetical protein